MNQQDLVVNNIPIVLNTSEEGNWTEDNLIILKNDVHEEEIFSIINYLYEEAFIQDRRITYRVA